MSGLVSLRLLFLLLGLILVLFLAFAWLLRRQNHLLDTIADLQASHDTAKDPLSRFTIEEVPPYAVSGIAFSRMGLVTYDAFEPGEDHKSFSLCLINDYDDGMMVTALSYDDRTRLYAKKIHQGRIEGPSSDEELRALADAKGFTKERSPYDGV